MEENRQSSRLTRQQKGMHGAVGIFGEEAKLHDMAVSDISHHVLAELQRLYPRLRFRHRSKIEKSEINAALRKLDNRLGQTLFVESSNIVPDGGIIEVQDDEGHWRVVLVSEAKHQGRDIENVKAGKLVGVNHDQDIMVAGNAIERAHKNIDEIANYMLNENHFPYVIFLEGSNFLTESIHVKRPDGREVTLEYHSGKINRLDRLTAANYGLPINMNLCRNIFVEHGEKTIMLQAASIYTQGDGGQWDAESMFDIMLDISKTSLKALASDIFNQITV